MLRSVERLAPHLHGGELGHCGRSFFIKEGRVEGVSLLLWPWPLQRQLSQIRPRLDCFLVAPEDPLASGPSMSGDRRRLGRGDDTSNESTLAIIVEGLIGINN